MFMLPLDNQRSLLSRRQVCLTKEITLVKLDSMGQSLGNAMNEINRYSV